MKQQRRARAGAGAKRRGVMGGKVGTEVKPHMTVRPSTYIMHMHMQEEPVLLLRLSVWYDRLLVAVASDATSY